MPGGLGWLVAHAAETILLDPENLGLILSLFHLAVTVCWLPLRPMRLTDPCGGCEGLRGCLGGGLAGGCDPATAQRVVRWVTGVESEVVGQLLHWPRFTTSQGQILQMA